MNQNMAESTIQFIHSIVNKSQAKKIDITFHGGEPLLTPYPILKYFLKQTKERLSNCNVKFKIQSNLWELDDKLGELLKEYQVSIGTSLDGPEHLCDLNRGQGYWAKTMKGISIARKSGLNVSGIATLSNNTVGYVQEIAEFFLENHMQMALHPTLQSLNKPKSDLVIDNEAFTNAIKRLYPWYIEHKSNISISTLDSFCKGFVKGNPGVCTFQNCFGMFLVIDPKGDIYHCQRFCGMNEYKLGNISEMPTMEQIYNHPNAEKIKHREKDIILQCSDCSYNTICKGGCYYNALSSGDGIIDPLCNFYKQIFGFVQKKILEEMCSQENVNAMVENTHSEGEHPLLRKGDYISLALKKLDR